MLIWRDHCMTRRVWKQVQDDEIVNAAKDDELVRVAASIVSDTEDTRRWFLARGRQIIVAPGTPDKIHYGAVGPAGPGDGGGDGGGAAVPSLMRSFNSLLGLK